MAQLGEIYGKWRVVEIYDLDGVTWAVVQNTRNPQVKNRLPVSDLETLNGSA
jgi:hypothetical protein